MFPRIWWRKLLTRPRGAMHGRGFRTPNSAETSAHCAKTCASSFSAKSRPHPTGCHRVFPEKKRQLFAICGFFSGRSWGLLHGDVFGYCVTTVYLIIFDYRILCLLSSSSTTNFVYAYSWAENQTQFIRVDVLITNPVFLTRVKYEAII